MTDSKNHQLKVLQCNARGLTKSRLEEFRHFLSLYNPSVVLLSETHWNDSFSVQFSSYVVIKKNRQGRFGGGVAILVKKSIQFSLLSLEHFNSIEAVGISISSPSSQTFDCISVYAPKGDSPVEEIDVLLNRPSLFIVGGDFNAHHPMWESNSVVNRGGNAIWSVIMDRPSVNLLTPLDLGTRIDPASGKLSTIDLSLSSLDFALNSSIKLGPNFGCDHFSIMIELADVQCSSGGRAPRWVFKDDKWDVWNDLVAAHLEKASFLTISAPEVAYQSFHNALIAASTHHFKRSDPSSSPPPQSERRRPWWDKNCNAVVHAAKKAFKEWRDSPLSQEKRTSWKKADAIKRRHILKAKREAWKEYISNLSPKEDPSKVWNFVRSMLGKKKSSNPLDNATLVDNTGKHCVSAQDKADLLLEVFGNNFSSVIPNNDVFESAIISSINSRSPNKLSRNYLRNRRLPQKA